MIPAQIGNISRIEAVGTKSLIFVELVEGINEFTSGEVTIETLLGNSSRKIASAFIARLFNENLIL